MEENDLGDDLLVDPLNMRVAKNVIPANQNWKARDSVHQQPTMKFDLDDVDNANLDGDRSKWAIIPAQLAPSVKFNIMNTII